MYDGKSQNFHCISGPDFVLSQILRKNELYWSIVYHAPFPHAQVRQCFEGLSILNVTLSREGSYCAAVHVLLPGFS